MELSRNQNGQEVCRVLVVCRHPIVRVGLSTIINLQLGFQLCGEASSGEEALVQLAEVGPDVAVLSVSVTDGIGLHLIGKMKRDRQRLQILVSHRHDDLLFVGKALSEGATGYISEYSDQDTFVKAIKQVAVGKTYLSQEIAQQILKNVTLQPKGEISTGIGMLTEREMVVFELMGRGLTTTKIARRLKISVHTVESYRERIRWKMGAKNGADLTFRAISWMLLNQ